MVSCPTGALTEQKRGGGSDCLRRGSIVDGGGTAPAAGVCGRVWNVSGAQPRSDCEAALSQGRSDLPRRRFRVDCVFYQEGQAQVALSTPIAHVKTHGGGQGFFKRLTSVLVGREQDNREEEARDRTIPIDASVDLAYGNPVAELGAGDLFGEMTCMNFYPRSATVRAATEVVAYEMLRNVLDIMMKNKTFRAQLDENYRRRALETHLRGVPMFAGTSRDFIERLKGSVELVRFAPGQMIAPAG